MPNVNIRYMTALSCVSRGRGVIAEQQELLTDLSKMMDDLANIWSSASQRSWIRVFQNHHTRLLEVLSTMSEGLDEMYKFLQDCWSLDQEWVGKIRDI